MMRSERGQGDEKVNAMVGCRGDGRTSSTRETGGVLGITAASNVACRREPEKEAERR